MIPPLKLTGIGLRKAHYIDFLNEKPPVAWVEVHSENYFGEGGVSLQVLEKIRNDYPVSLHGVNLSLGSSDELNWHHLKQLRDLIIRIQPCLLSEHLSWSSIHGQYLHELLPLPYTQEVIEHVVSRIQIIQDYLQQPLLIENIAHYLTTPLSEMPEYDFLQTIVKKSGCKILLDINNLYINSQNLGICAADYLSSLDKDCVEEIHLGGFSTTEINGKTILIDSHNNRVATPVWDLYQEAIQQFGVKPTIIEWDNDIPDLTTLCKEAHQAELLMREAYATRSMAG